MPSVLLLKWPPHLIQTSISYDYQDVILGQRLCRLWGRLLVEFLTLCQIKKRLPWGHPWPRGPQTIQWGLAFICLENIKSFLAKRPAYVWKRSIKMSCYVFRKFLDRKRAEWCCCSRLILQRCLSKERTLNFLGSNLNKQWGTWLFIDWWFCKKFVGSSPNDINIIRWQFLPYKNQRYWTTYPLLLVNVVCERPLRAFWLFVPKFYK